LAIKNKFNFRDQQQMRKIKNHCKNSIFPVVFYLILCIITISILCLSLLFFPKGSDEGIIFLTISSIIWFIFGGVLFYKERSNNTIYKIHISLCKKFNWQTRKFCRAYFTTVLIYLFLAGGTCACLEKYNHDKDIIAFQLYLQTLPFVVIGITILFIFLYIIARLKVIKRTLYIFKQIDLKNNLNQIIPIIASIIFLFLAIFEIEVIDEDAFYSLLKIIVSATLFYIAFIIKNSKSILFWLAISLGILFNPIVQIHLNDSGLWVFIDIVTIVFFLIYSKNKFYINIKKQVLYELDLIQLKYKNNTRSYNELIYSATQNLFTTIKNKIKQHSVVNFKNNPKVIAYDIILNVCISELGYKGNRLWTSEENYIALLGKDCIDFFEKNGYYTRQQASSAFKELSKTFKGNKFTDKDGKVFMTIIDGNRINN
jgi:hypothetical protein